MGWGGKGVGRGGASKRVRGFMPDILFFYI